MSDHSDEKATYGAKGVETFGPVADHERRGSLTSINMNKNLDAKIQNPLAGMTREELMADVDAFAAEHALTELSPLLRRAALVAQRPTEFDDMPEITEDERYHLRLCLDLSSAILPPLTRQRGWDQTGSNGANLSFPTEFGIGCGELEEDNPAYALQGCTPALHDRDNWLVGLVNAGPYIGAAGCWLSDPCNIVFGRRGTIFISGIFVLLTPIGGALAQTWEQLLITRLIMGIGMGLKGSTVPVFAAENAPATIRGALVMSWQMWTAFGIFLGFCANLAVKDTGAISWRLQIGSAFIPAVPLVALIFFCPGCTVCFATLHLYMKHTPDVTFSDLYYIYTQLQIEKAIVGHSTLISRFTQLFTVPRIRRATLASFTVMIAQQMCGINIIAFYSSTVFRQAGAGDTQALLASWGFGLVNFTFAWPAIWTIDTFGRRSLLLFTFPQMAWTLLAAGLCFLIPEDNTAHLGLIAFFIFLFAAFYSPGEGPVPWTYSAEVFPLSHREVGMGFGVATTLFWSSVLAISFPRILTAFTPTGAFGFYAGLNVLAFIMIFFFMPETKQRTLEELDYVFAVPGSRFINYQTKKAVPYFIQHHVLRRKNVKLEPLYHFEGVAEARANRQASISKAVEDKGL
ncbi:hypothetical protein FH972_021596 [Carpinus fangiana]|uniref:Major facilitator superfamily (MFS) profile domain-containing protein n=1 Tax=Carpinus fangiana TaxID=176857 RepID=A0A5N6KQE0_9ROSI|nr:hypothetical protein FH972_021596 [Carpinus fangiana]